MKKIRQNENIQTKLGWKFFNNEKEFGCLNKANPNLKFDLIILSNFVSKIVLYSRMFILHLGSVISFIFFHLLENRPIMCFLSILSWTTIFSILLARNITKILQIFLSNLKKISRVGKLISSTKNFFTFVL